MATTNEDNTATAHASTAAPPTGKDGVSVSHAAATSAGGGGVEEPETIATVEDDVDVCPKVSGGGSTTMDIALRARRHTGGPTGASPYAKPTKQGKGRVLVTSVWIFFRALRSLMYIFICFPSHTHPPLYIFPTHTHTHTRNAHSLARRYRRRNARE